MLGKHTAIYFVGRIIPGIASILTLAVFTRVMSPAEYGNYALVISAVGVLNVLAFQWLGLGVSRYYAAYAEVPHKLIGVAFAGFAGIALLIMIGGLVTTGILVDHVARHLVFWGAFIALAQGWFDLNLRISGAQLNPVGHGLATSLKALLALIGGIILFESGFGVSGVFCALALSLIFSTLIVNRKWLRQCLQPVDLKPLRGFLRFGVPLSITSLLIICTDMSGRLFIGWLMDANAVGLYAPAFDLAQQTLGMLMGVISLASFPLVVNALERKGIDAARLQIQAHGRLLVAISVPATCGLIVLAPDIASAVMGGKFREVGGQVIPVIALATFASGMRSGFFDFAFQLGNRTGAQVWVVGTAAIVNVALNWLCIPLFGILGAAYATLVALVVALIMSIVLGRKIFVLPPFHRETITVILTSLIIASLLFSARFLAGNSFLIIKAFVGAALYCGACLWFNINNFRDFAFVRLHALK